MAKFVYKMQSILDIKYKLENQAKAEYGMAVSILQGEKLKLDKIYDDIDKYKRELRYMNDGVLDVMKLKESSAALSYKRERLRHRKW